MSGWHIPLMAAENWSGTQGPNTCMGWVERHIPPRLALPASRALSYLMLTKGIDEDLDPTEIEEDENVTLDTVNEIIQTAESALKADFPQYALGIGPNPAIQLPAPPEEVENEDNEDNEEPEEEDEPEDEDQEEPENEPEEEPEKEEEDLDEEPTPVQPPLKVRVDRLMAMCITTRPWAKELMTQPPWTDTMRVGVLNLTKRYMPGESTPAQEIMTQVESLMKLDEIEEKIKQAERDYTHREIFLPIYITKRYTIESTSDYTTSNSMRVSKADVQELMEKIRNRLEPGEDPFMACLHVARELIEKASQDPDEYAGDDDDAHDVIDPDSGYDILDQRDASIRDSRITYSHAYEENAARLLKDRAIECGIIKE